MTENRIILDHVFYTYDADAEDVARRTDALKGVSLTIDRGEYVAILGHNGSGKSTLAKLLSLVLLPTAGTVTVDGIVIDKKGLDDRQMLEVRRKVGMVFQNPEDQMVATVVEEDVAFGPENLGLPRDEIRRRVDRALATVEMTDYAMHAPHKLSGGQKQRVAIAGVLAIRPDYMVFDESTAMLDPRGRREILAVMKKLHDEEGITVIHITHHMSEAVRAGRAIVLNDGVVVADDTPSAIFRDVETVSRYGLQIPQGAELIHRLRARGYELPDALLPDECAEAVLSLFREVTR